MSDTKITDQISVVDDEEAIEWATWENMCEPREPEKIQLRNGKWVKFRPWIPQDRMAEIQRLCRGTGRGGRKNPDTRKFTLLVLKEIMLQPKVRTDQDKRAVMKADSAVIMHIINQVVDTEMFEQIQEDLGE